MQWRVKKILNKKIIFAVKISDSWSLSMKEVELCLQLWKYWNNKHWKTILFEYDRLARSSVRMIVVRWKTVITHTPICLHVLAFCVHYIEAMQLLHITHANCLIHANIWWRFKRHEFLYGIQTSIGDIKIIIISIKITFQWNYFSFS